MERSAVFSDNRIYRYVLTRRWDIYGRTLNVIGLNPSTADETVDDPTIRRCIRFAQDWGYAALSMTNLCAFRATKPADLMKVEHPIGPDNDHWLGTSAREAGMVLAAWGAHMIAIDIGHRAMCGELRGIELHCLGTTQIGAPRHPLYVPAITQPIRYDPQ